MTTASVLPSGLSTAKDSTCPPGPDKVAISSPPDTVATGLWPEEVKSGPRGDGWTAMTTPTAARAIASTTAAVAASARRRACGGEAASTA